MIVIVDFGSQTTHLISRRIEDLGVGVKIVEPQDAVGEIKRLAPGGIILSGGPASVYEKNAPHVDKQIFELGKPILAICYGQQLLSHLLGGEVKQGKKKEFGPANLSLKSNKDTITYNLPRNFKVWMSHGDEVRKIPKGFETLATTKTIPHAFIANFDKKIFGIQFHPEVVHTQFGGQLLSNFVKISGETSGKRKINHKSVQTIVNDIKEKAGNRYAICALSGGVDSSVASLLVHKAIGNRLKTFYIDSGLMREDETKLLEIVFKKHFKFDIKIIDARKEFLEALKGVSDPEQKRKIVGRKFIEIFEKQALRLRKKIDVGYLVQGTIYPDVIESSGTKHANLIKTHHNVGGLPQNMSFDLLEPLRNFYKDQVRQVGKVLGLPSEITQRHPFPGPGLAIRIVGEVTDKKLDILRKADLIVREETKHLKLWQAFAVFTGIKTTGVRGDMRAYGETIAVRLIEAKDAMSATWARVPHKVLEKISSRIVNEIPQVNRVVYDITTKPPATMEWE